MAETGNEHFAQAMNKVKDTCGRNGEIAGSENLYNIDAHQAGAQRKFDAARGMQDKILGRYPWAEAAANWINNTFVRWGENACKLIAEALPGLKATGEFKIPETAKVTKTETAKAPTVNKSETVWLSDYAAGIGAKRAEAIKKATE